MTVGRSLYGRIEFATRLRYILREDILSNTDNIPNMTVAEEANCARPDFSGAIKEGPDARSGPRLEFQSRGLVRENVPECLVQPLRPPFVVDQTRNGQLIVNDVGFREP